MMKLAVLADDLTGALDAAAPFAARGLGTVVALRQQALPRCLDQAPDIVAVSTDTRELDAEAARSAIANCMRLLPGGLPVFKKIDSRLKGNIAAELDAIPFEKALVIPAIPAFGRWVKDGRLGGFGVDEPIDIASRLGRHADRADIPDAAMLEDIAEAVERGGYDLPVGARGLAEALARRMAPRQAEAAPDLATSGITFVIGSRDPITRAQVAALKEAKPGLTYVAAPDGAGPRQLPARTAINLIEAAATGRQADPAEVAFGLADTLSRLAPPTDETIFISGGSTADIVLAHLGIEALQLLGEALPGLPIARGGRFKIITKSGGFGDRQTLVRLLGRLAIG
jgi:uncharacterized protein YgbK (DUF1537 family)